MNNAIMTWMAGESFCKLPEVWAFINSIDTCGFQGHKIVFTHNMDLQTEIKLKQKNYEIVHVDPKYIYCLVRDRFIYYRAYLLNNNYNLDNVLLVDSKDVIFQRDPFPLIESLNKDLILVSEGMKHSQSEWNKEDQRKFQENLYKFNISCDNWSIVNGGTIIGRTKAIAALCQTVWLCHLTSNQNSTEQAVLNYLTKYLLEDKDNIIVEPQIINLVLTGEAIKSGLINPQVIDNKVICPSNKEPYCLFHQWERTEHAKMFREIYCEKS